MSGVCANNFAISPQKIYIRIRIYFRRIGPLILRIYFSSISSGRATELYHPHPSVKSRDREIQRTYLPVTASSPRYNERSCTVTYEKGVYTKRGLYLIHLPTGRPWKSGHRPPIVGNARDPFFFSLSASFSESSSSTDRLYRARIRKRFSRETDKVSIPIPGRIGEYRSEKEKLQVNGIMIYRSVSRKGGKINRCGTNFFHPPTRTWKRNKIDN